MIMLAGAWPGASGKACAALPDRSRADISDDATYAKTPASPRRAERAERT